MYFAQLDLNDKVLRVIVADQEFISNQPGRWVETDIDGVSPKNYAGIGYTYDEDRDAFIEPKPFDSWVLNESTCRYEAPIPYPDLDHIYSWDEEEGSWVFVR